MVLGAKLSLVPICRHSVAGSKSLGWASPRPTITAALAPERKRGGADVEADLYDNCLVFTRSLLGVSKEGRESIPLWRVFSSYFSARPEKYGRAGARNTLSRRKLDKNISYIIIQYH